MCERVVLVAQGLVEVGADLLQELVDRLLADGGTQGQCVDKHTYGVADAQVGTAARNGGDTYLLAVGKA